MDPSDGFANGESEIGDLPFLDEHIVRIAASRDLVWTALQRYVATSLRVDGTPFAKILGTQPHSGFEVSKSRPTHHLTLVGRHRFSRYMLAFDVTDAGRGTTQLSAKTHAAFPGVSGRVYRTLLIGTGAHVIATRRILRSIRRLTIELSVAEGPTK